MDPTRRIIAEHLAVRGASSYKTLSRQEFKKHGRTKVVEIVEYETANKEKNWVSFNIDYK